MNGHSLQGGHFHSASPRGRPNAESFYTLVLCPRTATAMMYTCIEQDLNQGICYSRHSWLGSLTTGLQRPHREIVGFYKVNTLERIKEVHYSGLSPYLPLLSRALNHYTTMNTRYRSSLYRFSVHKLHVAPRGIVDSV